MLPSNGPNPFELLMRAIANARTPSTPETERNPWLTLDGRRYLNPLLAETVIPDNYPEATGLAGFLRGFAANVQARLSGQRMDAQSEDAWKLYLGLRPESSSWQVSPYKPSSAKNKNMVYFRSPILRENFDLAKALRATSSGRTVQNVDSRQGNALRNVTLERGRDSKGHYISIYDIYDLDVPGERSGRGFGRPFEIYDRIYYNPRTFQIVPEQ